MATTAGNDTFNVKRYGQTATWDALGGTDTVYFERLNYSAGEFNITKDSNTGAVHVDSTSSASHSYHLTLFNVEKLSFSRGGYIIDLSNLFPNAADTIAPLLSNTNPSDGATNFDASHNIVLTFNESIQKGTGLIQIHTESSSGPVVESYDAATSGNLSFSGANLTINPTGNLSGNTHYFVTIASGALLDTAGNAFAGNTSYSFTTAAPVGTAKADTLAGTNNDDILSGLAGNDVLIGNGGYDTLDGGKGIDSMFGGAGNDTYIVDNAADKVFETATATDTVDLGGIDTVQSSVSYVLGSYIENLTLTGSKKINGTGNALDNVITGNSNANILDGGLGNDTMSGGAGKDTYIVDSAGDIVSESGSGIDTVKASIDYTLTNNVENLLLTGSAIQGIGNALNNTITGNASENILDGGSGVDKLIGGAANDTYYVDLTAAGKLEDKITETKTGGIDTLFLRSDTIATSATIKMVANVENLDISNTGSSNLNITGDNNANTLNGNSGNNTINGGKGDDTLIGGAGNDNLIGGLGADTFVWHLADKGSNGAPTIDTIDFILAGNDKLDLRDLLQGESKNDLTSLLNFIDINTNGANTEIHISSTGGFSGGVANNSENAEIILANVNLLSATDESTLLQTLINTNKLIID